MMKIFEEKVTPDFDAFRRCILREGTPSRVHFSELYQDEEIKVALVRRFKLEKGLKRSDPFFGIKREIAIQHFLGYDMIRVCPPGFEFPLDVLKAKDATKLKGQARAKREWINEHSGPIQSWADIERYPWPEPANTDTRGLEWLEKNLPDGMAVYDLTSHILEQATWLMGYETLCVKMYEEPDLVNAVFEKVGHLYLEYTRLLAQFTCVGVIWGSDDMGFRTQTLFSPGMLREKVLPWHRLAAQVAHESGKLYFLHACGNVEAIMEDLIEVVKIDARHSFEDTIMPVTEVKRRYGSRIGILGGIDVDFLCRSNETEIRRRVRETLNQCHPGGGYCLGTGNSVANYIPLDNYLIMLDEGRRYNAAWH
jgi:uroporphyrinogen decarboxylase